MSRRGTPRPPEATADRADPREGGAAGESDVVGSPRSGDVAPAYVFSDQVGFLMRRAYQKHLAIFQRYAVDPQLTAVQLSTLCSLRDRGPSSQMSLVQATAVDQATIRGIIDRLRSRGLIALSTSSEDKRKVIAELTPAGGALVDAMIPQAHIVTEKTMESLNPAERIALVFLLRKLVGPNG